MLLTKRVSAFSSCGWRMTAVVLGTFCLAILQGVKLAASRMKEASWTLWEGIFPDGRGRCFFPSWLGCTSRWFAAPSACASSRRCPWPGSGPQLPRLGSLPRARARKPRSPAHSSVSYCLSVCLWLPTFCCPCSCSRELFIRTNRAGDKKQAVLPFWF